MLPLLGFALLVLLVPGACENTVADYIGSHMMSELLTPEECGAFYGKIKTPEENVVKQQLSEGRNRICARKWHDITSAEQCKTILSHWLHSGDTKYWHQLPEILQPIGHSDAASWGRKLGQQKIIEMKENMGDYYKTGLCLNFSLLLDQNEMHWLLIFAVGGLTAFLWQLNKRMLKI